jgi:hypothetical protein
MESIALGSTMAVNRSLLDRALPIPGESPYQDCWFAVVAAGFGRLIPIPQVSIFYRRHDANQTAVPYSSSLFGSIFRLLRGADAMRHRLDHLLDQSARIAGAYLLRFGDVLPEPERVRLSAISGLKARGRPGRGLSILRHGLRFSSPLKSIGLILLSL